LADLLRHSNAKVTCLVRANDPRDGARRLTASLQRYGLTSACSLLAMAIEGDRVEVITGDLGRDYLGLSATRFAKLGSAVTDVVHAGGMVNFLAGYLDHQPANVLGVQELIKLAGGNCSRLHVLSTLSIFPLAGDGSMPIIHERQLPDEDRVATDGYSRSRYVAERLLEHARTDGVHSVVYRLGEVWPHRGLGVANPTSVAHNVLYACAQTGCVFDTNAVIDVTPVDVVSRFVVRCTIGEVQIPDGTLHILWPTTLRFADAFGVLADRGHLDRVSYAEFRRRLEIVADGPDPDERLVRLRMMLPPAGLEARAPREFDRMFAASGRYFSADGFVRHSASMSKAPTNPVDTLDTYLAGLAALPRHATASATTSDS
jgi:thioester reductase-like protein